MQTRSTAGISKPVPAQAGDSALRRFTGYRMKRAYNTMRADLQARLEPLGLRITTYSTLVLVVDNPGLRQSALADTLEIKRSNMVLIVEDLEHRGWITRKQIPADRRAYAIYPTRSGKRICDKAIALDMEHEAALLNCLSSEELNRFTAVLEKIESFAGEASVNGSQ